MKRTILFSALVLAGLSIAAPAARAEPRVRWGFGFGFGSGGGYFEGRFGHGHRGRGYRGHVHVRVPIYERIWVDPVYDTVCVGRDRCGRPIYRTVLVRPGCYESVIVGYRCGSCRLSC